MRSLHSQVTLIFVILRTALAVQNELSSHPPLRCCFMEQPPISFRNPRSNWQNGLDGVVKDHLLQHQSYLNWTCSSMVPFPQTKNIDFNSFISSMFECTNKSTGQIIQSTECKCDIGIAGWFLTSTRFGKVSFLPPFVYDRYVVFTHVSQATVSGRMWFFLETFDKTAWICIATLFMMFTFLKILDRRFEPPAPFRPLQRPCSRFRSYIYYLTKSRLLYRLRKAFQSTVMRMFMLSDERVVASGTTTRQWTLNMILAVASLFLLLSYEASMTASLVQESIQSRFQATTDLQNCRIDPTEMCILKGNALETYWNHSIAIGECHVQNPPHLCSSYEALYNAVESGQCKYAIVRESAIMSAIRERYCGKFVIVGDPIFDGGLSLVVPLGSTLAERMSMATLELQHNGSVATLGKYFATLPRCRAEVNSSLSFGKLKLFFTFAYTCGAVIFLAMVLVPQQVSGQHGSRAVALAGEELPLEHKLSLQRNGSCFAADEYGSRV